MHKFIHACITMQSTTYYIICYLYITLQNIKLQYMNYKISSISINDLISIPNNKLLVMGLKEILQKQKVLNKDYIYIFLISKQGLYIQGLRQISLTKLKIKMRTKSALLDAFIRR